MVWGGIKSINSLPPSEEEEGEHASQHLNINKEKKPGTRERFGWT